MLHEPSAPVGKDPAQNYKTRLGVWMVLCYSLFYAGFVAINLLNPAATSIRSNLVSRSLERMQVQYTLSNGVISGFVYHNAF